MRRVPDIVSFYLNGERVTVDNPSPDLLLIDYLRSPEVGLTGAKKGCGQGGCGACTVLLSSWDSGADRMEHRSINSCLRPVCALDGMAVTTIEGTGQVERLAPEQLSLLVSFLVARRHRATFSGGDDLQPGGVRSREAKPRPRRLAGTAPSRPG